LLKSEADHPFFRPLWRRVAITLVCAVWAALEWYGGQSMWAWIATGMTAYAVWMFLLSKRGAETNEKPEGQD
jgi:hypothetical protein